MSEVAQNSKVRGFVTIDSIVRSYLMDIGAGMERYEQGKHYVLEGYRDFHFDVSREVKTIRVGMTPYKAIELPTDFVDLVMLGLEIDNNIQVMTNDGRIPLPTLDDDEDGAIDPPTISPEFPIEQLPGGLARYQFWNVSSQGEDLGQLYGWTTKSNGVGYWRMNTERREIQLTPSIDASTIMYMEYISDGINPCERTTVTVYAAKLLKLYAHWQRLKFSKAPRSHVVEAKEDYYAEYYMVQSRLNPITVADVLECARNGYKLISSF